MKQWKLPSSSREGSSSKASSLTDSSCARRNGMYVQVCEMEDNFMCVSMKLPKSSVCTCILKNCACIHSGVIVHVCV